MRTALVTLAVFLAVVAVASGRRDQTLHTHSAAATQHAPRAPRPPTLRLAKGARAVRPVITEYREEFRDGSGWGSSASLAGSLPLFRAAVGARVIIDTRRPARKLRVNVDGHWLRTKRLCDTRWRIRAPRRSGDAELRTTYAKRDNIRSRSVALVRLEAVAAP